MATSEVRIKYSKTFLLALSQHACKVDSEMLQVVKSLHLDRSEPQSTEKCPKSQVAPSKSPDPRKAISSKFKGKENQAQSTPATSKTKALAQHGQEIVQTLQTQKVTPHTTKTKTVTPKTVRAIGKENLPNARQVSATAQKPLQTVKQKTSSKPVETNACEQAQQEQAKTPVFFPSSPPLLLSPEPVAPSRELALSPSVPGGIEKDPHRLSQRQKQITYGYRTLGYLRYRLLVPRDKRRPEHPNTPNKERVCSKRSWDGQVKKWRRELHKWDPAADSGFVELLTADILESLFEGVPGISELIKGLKEKLAQGTLGEPEEEETEETLLTSPPTLAKNTVVRTLVF